MVMYSSYATPRLDLGRAYMEFLADEALYPEFCATTILPIAKVSRQAASYAALTRETMLAAADAKRAAKSGYNRIDIGAEDKTYTCQEFGLEGLVDDKHRALYANDFDLEMAIMRQITRKLRLAQEIRTATLVFNTTTWTGSSLYTDVSSANPWDTASSDVIATVIAAKEKVRVGTGMSANALILGRAQMENLLKNTAIIARVPGAAIVSESMLRNSLAAIFGLQKLIVGNAVKNTASEGATASLSDVWTDDYAMVARVAEANDPLDVPALGRCFLWTPESPEEVVVESYREEQRRGDVLRCRHDVDEVIQSAELGHLLKVD